ncbi:hypothetical protein K8R47_01400 [archaeon]|nr:hypothetical protein [archaeon]
MEKRVIILLLVSLVLINSVQALEVDSNYFKNFLDDYGNSFTGDVVQENEGFLDGLINWFNGLFEERAVGSAPNQGKLNCVSPGVCLGSCGNGYTLDNSYSCDIGKEHRNPPVCCFPYCSDDIDNDGDGLIDLSDPGCISKSDTSESCNPENSACSSSSNCCGDLVCENNLCAQEEQEVELEICNYDEENGYQVGNDLSLQVNEPDDGDEFDTNEEIIIDVDVENNGEDDLSIYVEAWLFDLDDDESIENEKSDRQSIDSGDEETFEFTLIVPDNAVENHDYYFAIKAYKNRDENEQCVSEYFDVEINEVECYDDDDDGYDTCENDCNDHDEDINPGENEVCSDNIDNDCDGYIDNADSECGGACNENWNCGEWNPGDCSFGQTQIRVCNDLNNCGTTLNKPNIERLCQESPDDDDDGLPDEWELLYFGNLLEGPNGDYDNDGLINIDEFIRNTNPKVSDKISGNWLVIALIAFIVVVLGGVISYFVVLKKLKKKNVNVGKPLDPRLVSYVKKCREKGINDAMIKKELIKVGWKMEDINKSLKFR